MRIGRLSWLALLSVAVCGAVPNVTRAAEAEAVFQSLVDQEGGESYLWSVYGLRFVVPADFKRSDTQRLIAICGASGILCSIFGGFIAGSNNWITSILATSNDIGGK